MQGKKNYLKIIIAYFSRIVRMYKAYCGMIREISKVGKGRHQGG